MDMRRIAILVLRAVFSVVVELLSRDRKRGTICLAAHAVDPSEE
jgi:hypothetical protein